MGTRVHLCVPQLKLLVDDVVASNLRNESALILHYVTYGVLRHFISPILLKMSKWAVTGGYDSRTFLARPFHLSSFSEFNFAFRRY